MTKKTKTPINKFLTYSKPYQWFWVGMIMIIIPTTILCYSSNMNKGVFAILNILITSGSVISIGGIFGWMTSWEPIIKTYREELTDLLYSREILSKRKDISDIWDNVTEILIEEKFSSIKKGILGIVKNKYLKTEEISYFEEVVERVIVNWDDQIEDNIILDVEKSYTVITETKDKVEIPQTNQIELNKKDDNATFTILEFSINNISKDITNVKSEKIKHNENYRLKTVHKVYLEGETEYKLYKKTHKSYNYDTDFTIGYKAKFITKDYRLTLTIENELIPFIIERGTIYDFTCKKIGKNVWEFEYKGLILPGQGYCIVLHKTI